MTLKLRKSLMINKKKPQTKIKLAVLIRIRMKADKILESL